MDCDIDFYQIRQKIIVPYKIVLIQHVDVI